VCAYLHTVVSAQARVGSVCMRAAANCTINGRIYIHSNTPCGLWCAGRVHRATTCTSTNNASRVRHARFCTCLTRARARVDPAGPRRVC